jgi:DnaJ-class molecular chaperone
VNVVALCALCGGSGEVDGSEEICTGCSGEGVQLARHTPSERAAGLTLDQLQSQLLGQGLPFPPSVRTDLEEDQRSNAPGTVLREYDLG